MSEPVDLTKPVRLKSTKHRVYFPEGDANVNVVFLDGSLAAVPPWSTKTTGAR